MPTNPYSIDVDVQLVPGRGYSASYVIAAADGAVIHRRQLARRFSAYSEAMACALAAAKATAATLPNEDLLGLTLPHSVPRGAAEGIAVGPTP